jgi:hypothetical protein
MLVLFATVVCNGASLAEKVQPHLSAPTARVSNPQNPRRRSYTNEVNRQIDGNLLEIDPMVGRNVVQVRIIWTGEAMLLSRASSSLRTLW